ncbi:unnamed protein product, partial [Urochloa humidicola]
WQASWRCRWPGDSTPKGQGGGRSPTGWRVHSPAFAPPVLWEASFIVRMIYKLELALYYLIYKEL